MLYNKEQQIEERGEDPRKPIQAFSIRDRVFSPDYFRSLGRRFYPIAVFGVSGLALIGASQAENCSSDRGLLWSGNHSTLSVASQCEGAVFPLLPLTEKQEEARVRANVLTTNLGSVYAYLNVPALELPFDRVGGGRLMADAELSEIMKGKTITPEGSERIEVLQMALNNYTSEQYGAPMTLDFNNLRPIYMEDSSQPNNLSLVTVDNLRYLGVKDADIFRANARIHFQNGSPVEVKEWQTAIRPTEASPNYVISAIKSRLGNYSVLVEEDDEGWIALSNDPDASTAHGVRSKSVPVSLMLVPINEDPNNMMLVIVDRSCGNIIEAFPVPSITNIEELIEEMLPTLTAIPTNKPAGPAGPGPGGPGQPEQPTQPPLPPVPTVRPPSTPQPTSAIPPATSLPIRPPSTPGT